MYYCQTVILSPFCNSLWLSLWVHLARVVICTPQVLLFQMLIISLSTVGIVSFRYRWLALFSTSLILTLPLPSPLPLIVIYTLNLTPSLTQNLMLTLPLPISIRLSVYRHSFFKPIFFFSICLLTNCFFLFVWFELHLTQTKIIELVTEYANAALTISATH